MEAQVQQFKRLLRIVLGVLYAVSVAGFSYVNWTVEPEPNVGMVATSAVLLSIPLVLLYGAIYILLAAWYERHRTGTISPRLARVIHWAPRIAAILIIGFVTLFSFDVFGMEGSTLQLIGAFLLHSLPSIVMAVGLAFAWRRPIVGAIAFLLASLVFLRFVIMGPSLAHFLLFSGPLLLIAGLFYADWRQQQATAHPGAAR